MGAIPPASRPPLGEPRFPFAAGRGRVAVALVLHEPAGPGSSSENPRDAAAESSADAATRATVEAAKRATMEATVEATVEAATKSAADATPSSAPRVATNPPANTTAFEASLEESLEQSPERPHEEPLAAAHLDLFVARDEDADFLHGADREARCARAFRLPLDFLRTGRHLALETAPHRADYLDLRTRRELSGGRGVVSPLARGAGTAEVDADGALTIRWTARACFAPQPAGAAERASWIDPWPERGPALGPELQPELEPELHVELRLEPTSRPAFRLTVSTHEAAKPRDARAETPEP